MSYRLENSNGEITVPSTSNESQAAADSSETQASEDLINESSVNVRESDTAQSETRDAVELETTAAAEPETNDAVQIQGSGATETNDIHTQRKWPKCWTDQQVSDFTHKYTWLFSNNNCLGCSVCKDAKLSQGLKIQGMSVPLQWCNATVQPYGDGRPAELKSLRKKIAEHKESNFHKMSVDALSERSNNTLPRMMHQATEQEYETTARVFRTAYFLMKRERPFTDFPHLIDLQQANNTDMGSILHSRVTAAAICEHVGNEMRKNLIKAVIDSGEKIGIMIDEATTNSSKKHWLRVCDFF